MHPELIKTLQAFPELTFDDQGILAKLPGLMAVGFRYGELQKRSLENGPDLSTMLGQIQQQQQNMLDQLLPKVEDIINDENDPRSGIMQELMGELSELMEMNLPDADDAPEEETVNLSDLASSETPGQFDLQVFETATPSDVRWLLDHAAELIPGILEAARYAYGRLEMELQPEDPGQAVWQIPANGREQDYLDRVIIREIEVFPERNYLISFETPSYHLDEHGMYAAFIGAELQDCGEYDEVSHHFERLLGEFDEDAEFDEAEDDFEEI